MFKSMSVGNDGIELLWMPLKANVWFVIFVGSSAVMGIALGKLIHHMAGKRPPNLFVVILCFLSWFLFSVVIHLIAHIFWLKVVS
mmetsp:Transcript_61870/g.170341  ORF Transcript_61870/g.170341 Transcript_61870/m.170341 type:complete len:85 (+) Transcript_61870:1174-1428(+)